ncbi:hypothetical protein GGS23DRAFT_414398 [Durotheca rogersii]|uniref:uncharacterized protein n=1 Tax=Durotheca rogersii TaxID=419775 RepID=UPI00221F7C7E|nr:uncharacterized protein GGS23DRAFT_414398 [Durotheca rogersii]KAI5865202.1 hypothetical protein GGS23DRAFT_414398 [Durotheca rogersii]
MGQNADEQRSHHKTIVCADHINSEPAPMNIEGVERSKPEVHVFNEQTNYVPVKTVVTVSVRGYKGINLLPSLGVLTGWEIFLACASVDLVALMDQTTLAASLYIISDALEASNQASWIASGYFITSTVGQLLYGCHTGMEPCANRSGHKDKLRIASVLRYKGIKV